jgi:hypothetical protein
VGRIRHEPRTSVKSGRGGEKEAQIWQIDQESIDQVAKLSESAPFVVSVSDATHTFQEIIVPV